MSRKVAGTRPRTNPVDFEKANEAKASFDEIYNCRDPRGYFTSLGALDYRIPAEANPLIDRLLSSLGAGSGGGPVHVLDLGCSYGINAALMKYDITLDELYRHYCSPAVARVSSAEMTKIDCRYFSSREKSVPVDVVGLDVADRAIAYAIDVGLLDDGIVENLENDPLSPLASEKLAATDLVVSTGCVGYVGEKTFARILSASAADAMPWVASFVLRVFPYDRITKMLSHFGLRTERLGGVTFRQRRFADREESQSALKALTARGIDPTGREAEGYYHADFYLSRPDAAARARPLDRLIADFS